MWKFSPPDKKRQMEWPSPWGVGFPGWHIECSAMSMKYLGETFDIHCGGIDHIPVHHPNEIAQSEAATSKPLARWWLHGEFLVVDAKRMGKSENNFLTLNWLKQEGLTPLAYRYFCLGTHYRKPLNFSLDALAGAAKALQNLQDKVATMGEASIGCAEFEQKFIEAMNDDLNAPQALAVLWELMASNYPDSAKKQSLLKFDAILGLGIREVKPLNIPPAVTELITKREEARQAK
ncbi:MAG: cysteine--tRNA ligase, partial [Candidatus Kerfeldbacteria bacterium]|nr:cysteine--tRNA ligase [Candidatus Kerfeldbacteria bacterium]